MTARITKARRLDAAGFAAVQGWLPKGRAEAIMREVERHREEVERIAAEAPRPRGRPKKVAP